MQATGETDPDTCAFNDLALVRIDPADVANVNPTVPHWGGPVGLDTDGTAPVSASTRTATPACASASPSSAPRPASASARGRLEPHVYTLSPGIPGDSAAPS